MRWTATPDTFHATPGYQPLLRQLGLDAETVFTHPDIRVWRSLPERENATLDSTRPDDGSPIRLHVKRYRPTPDGDSPAEQEANGIKLLQRAGIPTVPLVGWGKLRDGRSFLITEDLAGYQPADKAITSGTLPADQVLPKLAQLAAKLHNANLHHRDLYLCHFFVNQELDVRLIDPGRVKELPKWPWRRRWVVKDLGQTWYSMGEIGCPAGEMRKFIDEYGKNADLKSVTWLTRSIAAKARRIARHDRNLRRKQPTRNVSIPE